MKKTKVSVREYALTKFLLKEGFKATEIILVTHRSPRVIGFIKRSRNYSGYLRLVKEYNEES
jgi:hypothetical protein